MRWVYSREFGYGDYLFVGVINTFNTVPFEKPFSIHTLAKWQKWSGFRTFSAPVKINSMFHLKYKANKMTIV